MNKSTFIIVIGASAGGLQAVTELMAQLTADTNAAVFVVLHLNNMSDIAPLVQRVQRNSVFTCKAAEHDEPIRAGYLYLALPDQHMLVKDEKVIIGRGALENR